jgi:hypothetical protein
MRRRGGVLLEVLVSIALFIGAGAFALAAMRTTFDNIDRARRDQAAIDLARSKMAELEAGLVSLADLRGGPITDVGSVPVIDDRIGSIDWVAEVRTRRTEYRDLTLVELTVREGGAVDDPRAARFTLRQLLKLRDFDPEDYEEDDLLRGLPRTNEN